MNKNYRIKNLDCAHCAGKIERAVAKLAGVRAANLNFMAQKLSVEMEEAQAARIDGEIKAIVKKLEPDCVVIG